MIRLEWTHYVSNEVVALPRIKADPAAGSTPPAAALIVAGVAVINLLSKLLRINARVEHSLTGSPSKIDGALCRGADLSYWQNAGAETARGFGLARGNLHVRHRIDGQHNLSRTDCGVAGRGHAHGADAGLWALSDFPLCADRLAHLSMSA